MKITEAMGLALATCCMCSASWAFEPDIDYGGAASIAGARTELPLGGVKGDLLITAGPILYFDSGFELEGIIKLAAPLFYNVDGLRFGGSIFGGFSLPPTGNVKAYFGLGISADSYRTGCEYVYGTTNVIPECRDTYRGYTSAGYRVGLKFKEFDDKRFRILFQQTFGRDGFDLMMLSFGFETR